ncbi:hypothetical protein E2C01_011117 [Portunus trituberculatus]|uniref:Uncharacterized protein n=1 Tax=Portunus trituberculatus TaxID=210409 RepID=A0A5B7DAL8_PORTR|nr:hypothetical protein [Portunus trituberculatus]
MGESSPWASPRRSLASPMSSFLASSARNIGVSACASSCFTLSSAPVEGMIQYEKPSKTGIEGRSVSHHLHRLANGQERKLFTLMKWEQYTMLCQKDSRQQMLLDADCHL